MSQSTKNSYRQRYQDALKAHVCRRPSRRFTSLAARSLGRDGLALGMDIFDLVRMHDEVSTTRVQSKRSDSGSSRLNATTPEGAFLLEAMKPFEKESDRLENTIHEAQRLGTEQLDFEIKQNKQLLSESHRLQKELQRLAHQLLMAQEEERKEISRELHDEVAQILAGINVRLAVLKESGTQNHRELQRNITMTQRLVEKSVKVVHRYARKLRPAMLDDLGLIPALRSFIKDFPGSKNLNIRLTADSEIENLNNHQRTVLYRVAQEALTNVSRHAHAKNATVHIQKIRDTVLLKVRDNGKSFPVHRILASDTHKRLGLLGMRERVEMAGGTFSITSSPDKGTVVRAEIPFIKTARAKA